MIKNTLGFTLIEMMAALVLSMVFITPLYIITRDLNSQADAQKKNIHAMQQARTGLALITEDLRRTALGASPNPQTDPLSATRNFPTSSASDRRAVAVMPHNPDVPERFDSIMLVGNFITSRAYQARAQGNQLLVDLTGLNDDHELHCAQQFSADYAYVHVFGPKNLTIDMKVESVSYAGGICTVTLVPGDMNELAYVNGDPVWVMANQAVLYQVEQVTEPKFGGLCNDGRYQLVRYYVNYEGGECDRTSLLDSAEVLNTKQVVADYVQDFQVWFRPVTPVSDGTATRLQLNQDTLINHIGGADVLVPDVDDHYITTDLSTAPTAADLSCDQSIVNYGPEHVRSAMVQLSVRTETPEDRLDFRYFLNDENELEWSLDKLEGRAPLYTIAPYYDDDVASQCTDYQVAGAAYQVKTVMTEIMMPNLAARADFISMN